MVTIAVFMLLSQLPSGGVSMLDPAAPLNMRGEPDQIRGTTMPGGAKFEVLKKGETAYVCEITTPRTIRPIKQGETMYFTYTARCLAARNEAQSGSWAVRVQRAAAPWDGPYAAGGSVGKSWRTFHESFRADKDYPAGEMVITFHVATTVQSLEFKDLRWLNFGPGVDPAKFPINEVTYEGRDPKDPWRAQAESMIEMYRKADLVIKTKPGATVRVKMLRHEYPFATVTGVDPARTDADAQKFFAFMKANYSRVTVPIYWADWGWESPEARDRYLKNIAWCEQNGYRMKGHNLIWPSNQWAPKRVHALTGEALSSAITKSLDERIAALRHVNFETIDVVNELVSEHDFEDKIGLGFAVEAFKKAHKAWPKADLVYNDYLVQDGDGVNPKFLAYAKKLKAAGAPVNLLGYQAHMGEAVPSITWLWKLLDTAKAQTGLPVEITEYDMNTRDDKAQGDYTRDIVTAWFAHPYSKGFTMWGFWEGDHWIPSSAMVRKDWTMRPAAKIWHELITKTWWTDVTVRANKQGIARVRGFKGDYEITSGKNRRAVKLTTSTRTTL